MSQCPTVTIKSDNEYGCIVINKSDFDKEKHVLFEAEKPLDSNDDGKVTKAELQAALDAKGIKHKPAMSKAELQAMLDSAE